MRAEEIRRRLKTQPFTPFKLCMSDGRTLIVSHPENAIVTRSVVAVADPEREEYDDDVPDELFWCDPVHIVRIEPVKTNGH